MGYCDTGYERRSGIYAIVNSANGKCYIGSACRNIIKRWHVHKHDLRNGKHHSSHLQKSWNKHGEGSFLFIVLEICPPDKCVSMEQEFIDRFESFKRINGYNMTPTAGSVLGYKMTQEQREAVSKRMKQMGKPTQLFTEESRKKVGAALKGRKQSPERIAKTISGMNNMSQENRLLRSKRISEALKGKKLPEKRKIQISQYFKSIPRTAKWRAGISESNRRRWRKWRAERGIPEPCDPNPPAQDAVPPGQAWPAASPPTACGSPASASVPR